MTKRSGAKQSAKPPSSVTFFIDRSLGRIDVPDRLRTLGVTCVLHDDEFDQGTEDAVWLSMLRGRGWIVLTKDERIRYRPLELNALKRAALKVFVVVAGNLRGTETAAVIASALSGILQTCANTDGPFLYYIYRNGSLRKIR